jgi:hypothetical protein
MSRLFPFQAGVAFLLSFPVAHAGMIVGNLTLNEAAFSFVLVPEPSTGLLGVGGLLLALRRRRV